MVYNMLNTFGEVSTMIFIKAKKNALVEFIDLKDAIRAKD